MYMICVYTWIFKWHLFRLIVSFGRIYMYIYTKHMCACIYIYVLKICVCVCVCACCHRRLCSLDRNTRLFVLMDGYVGFSPKYLRSFPRNIHSEISLENAQMEKCQEWCNCACLAKKTPQMHVFLNSGFMCFVEVAQWYTNGMHMKYIRAFLSLSLAPCLCVFVELIQHELPTNPKEPTEPTAHNS